jgi:hypothetical protein
VTCSGWAALAAFQRELRVPLADVTGARVVPWTEARNNMGWRTRGTYIPGRVAAGWFATRGQRGERQWWATFNTGDVLLVETRQTRPHRVVVQAPDAQQLAERLNAPASSN